MQDVRERVRAVRRQRCSAVVRCTKCDTDKPLSEFNYHNGLGRICRECRNAYNREWRAEYKEKFGRSYGE